MLVGGGGGVAEFVQRVLVGGGVAEFVQLVIVGVGV